MTRDKDEVIEMGHACYQTYDTDDGFLRMLKPYLEVAHRTKSTHRYRPMGANDMSNIPIGFEQWPPCIKNILSLLNRVVKVEQEHWHYLQHSWDRWGFMKIKQKISFTGWPGDGEHPRQTFLNRITVRCMFQPVRI